MPRYEPEPIVSLAESYRTGLLVLDGQREVVFRDSHLDEVLENATGKGSQPLLEALLERLGDTFDAMERERQQLRENVKVEVEDPSKQRRRHFVTQIVTVAQDNCRHWLLQIQDAEELERTARDMRLATRFRVLAQYYQATAHDLKQPIVVITMYLELLKNLLNEGVDTEDVRQKQIDYLGVIEESAKATSDSLQSLLTNVSDTDEARMAFELSPVIERTAHFVGAQARLRDITFDVHVPRQRVVLEGNVDQFRQVLTNLCINGIEAMPTGGTLTLAADVEDDEIVIRVKDTGVGMDEATAHRAFRIHYTTKPTGNGVGLNGVQNIVQSMGGRIAFETEPGKGTEFEVRIPARIHRADSGGSELPTVR